MPKVKLSEDQILTNFVDGLIEEKGVADLSAGRRAKLRQALVAEVNERMENAMIDALTDEQLVALNDMLDRGVADSDLEDFFKNAGVDFAKVSMKALVAFREEYLQRTDDAQVAARAEAAQLYFERHAPQGTGTPSMWQITPAEKAAMEVR